MEQPFDLPWAVNPFRAQIDCSAPSYKGGLLPVAQMLWPTDERSEAETAELAEFIVRAVNSHYQLVEALEEARSLLVKEGYTRMHTIDAALTAAKGTDNG